MLLVVVRSQTTHQLCVLIRLWVKCLTGHEPGHSHPGCIAPCGLGGTGHYPLGQDWNVRYMTNESVARVIITFLQSRVHTDQKHGHHNMVVSGAKTNVVFTALCKFSGSHRLGCLEQSLAVYIATSTSGLLPISSGHVPTCKGKSYWDFIN